MFIVPIASQRQHNFERGKGQCLHHVSEGGKERRLRYRWKLQKIRELQRILYQKAKQEKLRKPLGEDDWEAVYGKTVRTV